MRKIMKCVKCNAYTMVEKHCDEKTINPWPMKFSPEDAYGDYRRKAKEEMLKERGLL